MSIIDENKIQAAFTGVASEDAVRIREILAKAQEFRGLNLQETAELTAAKDPELLQEIFTAAIQVKKEIYGKRIVIFAPLYTSNECINNCLYCGFRHSNKKLNRKTLTIEEVVNEAKIIESTGHKRILLICGEHPEKSNAKHIANVMQSIYNNTDIRRINIEVAPMSIDDFKELKNARIGTYLVFQETYNREIYKKMHVSGLKADFDWRITAHDRALQAGIDDVGLGVLFGLYDWRFEVLALLEHANYLQEKFGVGPHTISVPRLEPALGSEIASKPLAPVSDIDFCKIVAILRLAIPYTGIIMSTREDLVMRRKTLSLGVSQISAGSRTNPGGYSDNKLTDASQFSLGDHRTLDEVVHDVASLGYMPSFCTACYRLGRTGEDFMGLAKHGKIKNMCAPNAIATFAEYLNSYASNATKVVGNKLIQQELALMTSEARNLTEKLLVRLVSGERDVFI